MPLLQRVHNTLMGCSTMLSSGGKLILIKSVFTGLPIHVHSQGSYISDKPTQNSIHTLFLEKIWRTRERAITYCM